MKKLFILLGMGLFALVGHGFATEMQMNIMNTLETQCNGANVDKVYYLGKTTEQRFFDTFNGDVGKDYVFGFKSSSVNIYNPYGTLEFINGGAFHYKSNLKPNEEFSVIVASQNYKEGTRIVNKAPSRDKIAAQIVFKVARKQAIGKGNKLKEYKYMLTDKTTHTVNKNLKFSSQTYIDNECLNIYVYSCGDGVIDSKYGEKCDPKDTSHTNWGNGGCSPTCEPINNTEPKCSSTYNGQSHYGQNWLNKNTSGLCTPGTVGNFTGPDADGKYSWICNGLAGTTPANCSADENWCGDGVKQSNETCDPKDASHTNWGNGGCSPTCEPVNKKTYDLALKKTLASNGPFKAGDEVKFNITVYNQGDVDAHNVEVVDYGLFQELTPDALLHCLRQDDYKLCVKNTKNIQAVLKDNGWENRNGKYYKTVEKIAAGESETISITFQIPDSYTGGNLKNIAEISKDDGDDIDSTPDNDSDNDCAIVDDKVDGACPTDEDDHDIAVITIEPLTPVIGVEKEVISKNKIIVGGKKATNIHYQVSLYNTNNPKNPVIVDEFPDNLCYNYTVGIDTNFLSFSKDGGKTWQKESSILDNKDGCNFTHMRYVLTDAQRKTSKITFKIVGFILEDKYEDGENICNHVVYSADDIQYDEDDACVVLDKEKVFDLALKKTLASNGPFKAGDAVNFNITVYNQGDVDAHNVEVVDYVPTVMQVTDMTWTVSGNKATKTIASLKAGQSTTLTISMRIKSDFAGTSIKNIAEISKDDGDDVDSTPDNDADNDCAIVDDKVDGACPTDEDDHDITVIPVGKEKLLITKKIVSNGEGDVYLPGEEVKFKITVKNTGTLTVNNITVKDFMPQSLTYVSSKITSNHTATLTEKVDGDDFTYTNLTLNTGDTFVFEVVGKVKINPDQNATTNCATVTSHNVGPVCDKFNLSPKPELDKKQRVNDSGSYVDAVLKVEESDTVNYKIVFKNTGSATSHNNQLVDKLPRCLSYVAGSASIDLPAGYNFEETIEGGADKLIYSNFDLTPGQVVTLTLDGKVKDVENCSSEDYKNTAILRFGEDTLTDDVVVKPEEKKLSCDIEVEDTTITLEEGDDEDVKITCEADGQTVDKIKIICDNEDGNIYTDHDVKKFSHDCNYTDEDKGTAHPRCEITDNKDNIDCDDNIRIKIDEDYYGVCGDGEKDAGEDCDWEGERLSISGNDRLFKYENYPRVEDKYDDNKTYECTPGCRLRTDNDFVVEPPRCLSTDVPISVSKEEKLPFWWRLEQGGKMNLKSDSYCRESNYDDIIDEDHVAINKDTIECVFKVYNATKSDEDSHGVYKDRKNIGDTITLDGEKCFLLSNPFDTKNDTKVKDKDIFHFFYDTTEGHQYANKWNYDWHINKSNGLNTLDIKDYFREGGEQYGEYKLVLEKVKYEYCDAADEDHVDWEDGVLYDRVCEVDFTVTEPYLIQKGLYGLFPVGASEYTSFFEKFYEMESRDGSKNLIKDGKIKYLSDTTITSDSTYEVTTELAQQIKNFKEKYKKLAVKHTNNISKVPGKNIFFKDGDLTIKGSDDYVKTKYTIIVNGNVTVEGSIKTNGMIIANNIKFVDGGQMDGNTKVFRCEEGGQVVQGIFIALGEFAGDGAGVLINDKEDKERCNYGNLKVKGVLIGNEIDTLVSQKRSHLNGRFWVNSHNKSSVTDERIRKEIFNGAAVLIEYNPYLWTDLPPGAKDFINALDIYKS